MTLNDLLNSELILVIALYGIRILVNMMVMNRIESFKVPNMKSEFTFSYSLFLFQYGLSFMKTIIKSTLKIWWTGDDYKFEKRIANGLSVLFYLSIITLILTFVIGYKI